jgi:hypothetical protein
MKAIGCSLVLLFAALATVTTLAQAPERRKLQHGTMVDSYPCAKGYAWFYANQKLKSCTLAVEIPFGSVTVPAGSIIDLTPEGKPALVQMSRAAVLNGFHCQGGSLLGPSEGAVVAFYPDGRLRELFLSEDQTIDGVPCAHGGLVSTLHGDPSVQLDPDGHLKSCRLSENYGSLLKGDRFVR